MRGLGFVSSPGVEMGVIFGNYDTSQVFSDFDN
jgi:hypothetical protein